MAQLSCLACLTAQHVHMCATAAACAAACLLLHTPPPPAGRQEEGAAGAAAWWSRPPACWPADEAMLAAGGLVVARLRARVLARLNFTCSAGVAHSKLLAKLASSMHKPAQQTLVPLASVTGLLAPLPLPRLRRCGRQQQKQGTEALARPVHTSAASALQPAPACSRMRSWQR